ncbi:MAG TPA: potassium/proton antiporter [Kineosporiaceae bacterium]|nr:potassium/proton antiporter [Kineosporiaceae bacterium]
MTVDDLGVVLLAASAVLLVAVIVVRFTARSGFPSLLLYLALGLLIGERGLGIRFDDARLTGVLGYAALVVILAEGGLTTHWSTIRDAVPAAAVLATLGTVVSVVVTGAAGHVLMDLSWPTALLLGAVVSSTDAAAVFSVLRRIPLPGRLTGLLEAESGFNDAPAVILVVALTAQAAGAPPQPWWQLLAEAGLELAVGAVVGLATGWVGSVLLRRIALPAAGLYPIAVLGLATAAFGAATVLHGSGFLSTYLAGLVLGNRRLPHGAAVRGFAEAMGWIAQIGLFVLLGLLADPARLPGLAVPAIGVGLALVLLSRPLSVFVSLTWFRVRWAEQAFLSWAGLRGAVPIVLATIPLARGVPAATEIFDVVFVIVVVFTLVQGPTLPWAARLFGVAGSVTTTELDLESSPLGALDADVLTIRIGPGSRLHGVEIFELRLPARANVTLVVRDGEGFVPSPRTALRHGDELIVVTAAAERSATERRVREVSAGGKLAGWRRGRLEPD